MKSWYSSLYAGSLLCFESRSLRNVSNTRVIAWICWFNATILTRIFSTSSWTWGLMDSTREDITINIESELTPSHLRHCPRERTRRAAYPNPPPPRSRSPADGPGSSPSPRSSSTPRRTSLCLGPPVACPPPASRPPPGDTARAPPTARKRGQGGGGQVTRAYMVDEVQFLHLAVFGIFTFLRLVVDIFDIRAHDPVLSNRRGPRVPQHISGFPSPGRWDG